MARHRRGLTPDALEEEARAAELGAVLGSPPHPPERDASALAGVLLHRDDTVRNSGGRDAGAAMPKPLRSDTPITSMLTLRYPMASRAGLIDMRHFIQLLYISWFFNSGAADMANSVATARGIEHEETSEAASEYKDPVRKAAAGVSLSDVGQRARLKILLGLP